MRWFCWSLIALMLSCTTGCSCGGGHSSLAEMKRRAIRPSDEDEAKPTPPPTPTAPVAEVAAPVAAPAPAQADATPAAVPPAPQTPQVPPPAANVAVAVTPKPAPPPKPRKRRVDNLDPGEVPDPPLEPEPVPLPEETVAANISSSPAATAEETPDSTPAPKQQSPTPPTPTPAQDTRLPIPDADAQTASKKLLAELYKPQYEQAKKPEQKQQLARTFLTKAEEISGDVTGHYLLLQLARDLAVQAGDVKLSLQTLNTLATTYQIDANAEKMNAFETLAKALRSQPDAEAFLTECKALLTSAIRQNDLELAAKTLTVAESVAKRGRMQEHLDKLTHTRKVIEEMKTAYANVPPALSSLEADPRDAEANLLVGRYYCFYRRDWHAGLQHLAACSDVKLRVLAQIDSSNPDSAAQQSDLADQWYDLAETITKPWAKGSAQLRSAFWYQQALPNLPNGLVKSRVQKRLSDIAAATGDESLKAFAAGKRNALPQD